MMFQFGDARITEGEIEDKAITTWCEHHNGQPARSLTEVFTNDDQVFVRLANVNGTLVTWRVVGLGDKIFLQELDEHELQAIPV